MNTILAKPSTEGLESQWNQCFGQGTAALITFVSTFWFWRFSLFRAVLGSQQSEAGSTGIAHLLPALTLCSLPHYQQPPPEWYIG